MRYEEDAAVGGVYRLVNVYKGGEEAFTAELILESADGLPALVGINDGSVAQLVTAWPGEYKDTGQTIDRSGRFPVTPTPDLT